MLKQFAEWAAGNLLTRQQIAALPLYTFSKRLNLLTAALAFA